VKGEGVTVVMRDLVDECVAVAKADGVTITGDVDAAVRKIAETVPGPTHRPRRIWRAASAVRCDRQADREQVADSSLPLATIAHSAMP
jgi:ketopantoate reductase